MLTQILHALVDAVGPSLSANARGELHGLVEKVEEDLAGKLGSALQRVQEPEQTPAEAPAAYPPGTGPQ